MTLWGGRFGEGPDEALWRFTVDQTDRRLLGDDVRGSLAHAAMLEATGIISAGDADAIHTGLEAILGEAEAGDFVWSDADEDVHSAVERRLGELIGPVAGKLQALPGPLQEALVRFDAWDFNSVSRDDVLHGFRKTFDVVVERSSGQVDGSRLIPETYLYRHKKWSDERLLEMKFDWAQNRVTTRSGDSEWRMAVPPGTLDKFAQQLALMSALADAGTGNYYYLNDATKLASVFSQEFEATRETVATGLVVSMHPGSDVTIVDAEAGVECERFRPHVVLLDLHLADGDGKGILQVLRNHDDLQMTKIIGMSGKLTDGQVAQQHGFGERAAVVEVAGRRAAGSSRAGRRRRPVGWGPPSLLTQAPRFERNACAATMRGGLNSYARSMTWTSPSHPASFWRWWAPRVRASHRSWRPGSFRV